MAISETSKAPSRTIGLKPLLVGEYSAKSSVTRSDLIAPFFSADVPGWSPSKVRKRIVISIGQGFIEIDEARLRQRLAHIVHVEPERASGKLLALALFVGPFDVADNDRLHANSSNLVNPERDDFSSNRHPALSFCLSMISGQTLRVCPEGKPVPTLGSSPRACFSGSCSSQPRGEQHENSSLAELFGAAEHI